MVYENYTILDLSTQFPNLSSFPKIIYKVYVDYQLSLTGPSISLPYLSMTRCGPASFGSSKLGYMRYDREPR